MATEAKVEPKTEAKPAEAKAAAVEENTEASLMCKTWVLKVSVDCEGCKKKVKKILQKVEGVYKTDIDLRQQKVTVVGNVEAETLIKKLGRKGKRVELWPHQKADQNKEKKKGKGKNKEKEKDTNMDHEISEEGNEEEKKTVKIEAGQVQDHSKASENGGATNEAAVDCGGGNVCKASETGGATVKASETGGATVKASGQIKEVKPNVKQTVTKSGGNQAPVTDKTGGCEAEGGPEKNGVSDSEGKRKKEKGNNWNNGNAAEGEHSGDVAAGTGSPSQGSAHVQGQTEVIYRTNPNPPRYHGHQYPPHLYPAPPAYAVNYHTAYPTTSYTASYYAPQYSYAYSHPGSISEPPPADLDSYPSQSSDSFEFFSDENPNACSIM